MSKSNSCHKYSPILDLKMISALLTELISFSCSELSQTYICFMNSICVRLHVIPLVQLQCRISSHTLHRQLGALTKGQTLKSCELYL